MVTMTTKRRSGKGKRTDPRNPLEHTEQVTFFQYMAMKYPEAYKRAAAIPNGGYRTKSEAARLKAEGVSKGYPDTLVDMPVAFTDPLLDALYGYHGFRLEMKRRKGSKFSAEQKERIKLLRDDGYFACVAYGADDALRYLALYCALWDAAKNAKSDTEISDIILRYKEVREKYANTRL